MCNRSQTLEINNQISDTALISNGVPQGSVLGPLLFLLYINDIHTCSDTFNFYLFADDTNILYANKNLRSLETTVNSELKMLYLWLVSNKLTLNIQKTNFVICHPYQKSVDYLPQLKIFDTQTNRYVSLEMKNYVKYLGILIDKNLSWKIHIDNVATKLSKMVGLIAKLRHFVPQHTLLNIYRALILPYLSYGLIVWGQASKTHLTKMLLLQKKVLRFIFFANRNVHAIPLFIDANILPISFLYFKSVSYLMHDIHTNTAPSKIVNLFSQTSSIHAYNTRSSSKNNIYIKKFNLEKLRQAVPIFGAKLWNEIPGRMRDMSKKVFKRKLISVLFGILEDNDDYLDATMITREIKSRNPEP